MKGKKKRENSYMVWSKEQKEWNEISKKGKRNKKNEKEDKSLVDMRADVMLVF